MHTHYICKTEVCKEMLLKRRCNTYCSLFIVSRVERLTRGHIRGHTVDTPWTLIRMYKRVCSIKLAGDEGQSLLRAVDLFLHTITIQHS